MSTTIMPFPVVQPDISAWGVGRVQPEIARHPPPLPAENGTRPALHRAVPESPQSSWQLTENVASAIHCMSQDYLAVFQLAVEKNNQFFTDFSEQIVAQLSHCFSADGDNVSFNVRKLTAALQALSTRYSLTPPLVCVTLFPPQSGEGAAEAEAVASKQQCEQWIAQFGLNSHCLVSTRGGWVVTADVAVIENVIASLPAAPAGSVSMNSARWSAWQTGFDQQKNNLQTGVQTLFQKYASAHALFENLVKVLSGTISNLLETDKAFLNL